MKPMPRPISLLGLDDREDGSTFSASEIMGQFAARSAPQRSRAVRHVSAGKLAEHHGMHQDLASVADDVPASSWDRVSQVIDPYLRCRHEDHSGDRALAAGGCARGSGSLPPARAIRLLCRLGFGTLGQEPSRDRALKLVVEEVPGFVRSDSHRVHVSKLHKTPIARRCRAGSPPGTQQVSIDLLLVLGVLLRDSP